MLLIRLFAVLLLAGCASTAPSQAPVTAPVTQTAELAGRPILSMSATFTATGRMTANYQKDGTPESVTVKFNWVQGLDRTEIELATPFGQTVAIIAITPEQASLTQPGKAPLVAPTIDALGEQTLGWSLPVSGLRHWMQGIATRPNLDTFVATPDQDRVETRDGWRLRFSSWQEKPNARTRPRRIDAERIVTGGNVESLAIRVVIDSWE